MRTKAEIKAKIRAVRKIRNDAQQYTTTEGFVFLSNGAIKALEWVLGYKRKPSFWCFRCRLLHTGLKCPKCGNEIMHKIANEVESDIELLKEQEMRVSNV